MALFWDRWVAYRRWFVLFYLADCDCLLIWFVGYDSLLLYINACVTIDRRDGIYDSESMYIKSNRASRSTRNPTYSYRLRKVLFPSQLRAQP
jgi:hypothetical protein